jgi:hypothetical protein
MKTTTSANAKPININKFSESKMARLK